jgi:hypothetical protein
LQYPAVEKGMRFLNSGGFMGPLDQVAEMLAAGGQIANTDDDQLFYTRHPLSILVLSSCSRLKF